MWSAPSLDPLHICHLQPATVRTAMETESGPISEKGAEGRDKAWGAVSPACTPSAEMALPMNQCSQSHCDEGWP